MSEKQQPENPPAFPNSTIDGWVTDGMTLRDYFAAKAMQGIVSNQGWLDNCCARGISPSDLGSIVVSTAYEMADAMLAVRQQPAPGEG